jgi:hypothetical protein
MLKHHPGSFWGASSFKREMPRGLAWSKRPWAFKKIRKPPMSYPILHVCLAQ